MSGLDTTELKLKSTPTGGMEAAHSPYYRRLLSAGYKGFLQGTIGGASFYGAYGLAIGGLLAIPAAFFMPTMAALAIIPAFGAVGLIKGASTFGNIGSYAAINAESAELSEQRRYLLDRYYDLPEGPEGDREAAVIKEELSKRTNDVGPNPPVFHWKAVAIGAAIGATLILGGLYFAGAFAGGAAGATAIGSIAEIVGIPLTASLQTVAANLAATLTGLTLMGGLAGGLVGSMIGLDRYYVRKWFDHTQDIVHSSSHTESAFIERSEQIERLKAANRLDKLAKQQVDEAPLPSRAHNPARTPVQTVSLDKPSPQISEARREGLAQIQKALEVPSV